MKIALQTELVQLASCYNWKIALIEYLLIKQIFDQSPLKSNDWHIQTCLAGNSLRRRISAACSQRHNNILGDCSLQRLLDSRGYFLVIVNQRVININSHQFVHGSRSYSLCKFSLGLLTLFVWHKFSKPSHVQHGSSIATGLCCI
ncbi:hypothetical protein D1872_248610 [compost metagenome]